MPLQEQHSPAWQPQPALPACARLLCRLKYPLWGLQPLLCPEEQQRSLVFMKCCCLDPIQLQHLPQPTLPRLCAHPVAASAPSPNLAGTANPHCPGVLLHSSTEGTATLCSTRPVSLLSVLITNQGSALALMCQRGGRQSLFHRDEPHKAQPAGSVLAPHLRAEGKRAEADFDPPRNSLHHHKASRQHQGLPVLLISL